MYDAEKKLRRATTHLVMSHPFFGRLAMGMPVEMSYDIPTASTNGKLIKLNPAFVEALNNEEIIFILAHEVMHVAMGHHLRRGERDKELWNAACDYVVNLILEGCKRMKMPSGGLLDHEFSNMSAEQIYSILQQQGKDLGGNSELGTVEDFPGDSTEKALEEQSVKIRTSQAAAMARAMGKMPGNLDRFVKELLTSKIDWRDILRGTLCNAARNDYTWRRPNRRFTGDIIHPSLYSEEIGEVCVAIDSSGSMSDEDLARAATEIVKITEDFEGVSVRVLYCDTRVYEDRVQIFEPGDDIVLKPKGGGGTDFRPVFEYLREHNIAPVCLLFVTDMAGRFPSEAPEYEVIWGTTYPGRNYRVPFGKVVSLV